MAIHDPVTIEDYMNLEYPFDVIADPEGGYVGIFPDLPGCMTQGDDLAELIEMAEDARRTWIEVALEDGENIPLPSYPETYSGRFNVRLPKSLHRRLVESAKKEGISLNQYVIALLTAANNLAAINRNFDTLGNQLLETSRIQQDNAQASSTIASARKVLAGK